MYEIKLKMTAISNIAKCTIIDPQVFVLACVESYTLYPTAKKNYIADAVRVIYNSITYTTSDSCKASSDIGSYVDEGKLLTALLNMHLLISKLLELGNKNVTRVYFKEYVNDEAIFHVDT